MALVALARPGWYADKAVFDVALAHAVKMVS
jgi:hypothetical protein